MKKKKLSLVGLAVLLLGGTSMYAQSRRGGGPVTLDKKYAGYHCVNLLDSTSVTVEPTGQGSFAVCRSGTDTGRCTSATCLEIRL